MDIKNPRGRSTMQISPSSSRKTFQNGPPGDGRLPGDKISGDSKLLKTNHDDKINSSSLFTFAPKFPETFAPSISAQKTAAKQSSTMKSAIDQLLQLSDTIEGTMMSIGQIRQHFAVNGLPFVFGVVTDKASTDHKESAIVPGTPHFEKLTWPKYDSKNRPVKLFYMTPSSEQIHPLGFLSELMKPTHPLMGCLIESNRLLLAPSQLDQENALAFSAVAHLAFASGFCVEVDKGFAKKFLSVIPKKDRPQIISEIMVEALSHSNLKLAVLALPLSKGIRSFDSEGHNALISSLRPNFEHFLTKLLSTTTTDDLPLLEDTLGATHEFDYPQAKLLVAKEEERLQGQLSQIETENLHA